MSVINPISGKKILIGKNTYRDLIAIGYKYVDGKLVFPRETQDTASPFSDLNIDIIAHVISFLPLFEIMAARTLNYELYELLTVKHEMYLPTLRNYVCSSVRNMEKYMNTFRNLINMDILLVAIFSIQPKCGSYWYLAHAISFASIPVTQKELLWNIAIDYICEKTRKEREVLIYEYSLVDGPDQNFSCGYTFLPIRRRKISDNMDIRTRIHMGCATIPQVLLFCKQQGIQMVTPITSENKRKAMKELAKIVNCDM